MLKYSNFKNKLYFLPWYQIYSRVRIIQNKIYESTRKCKFNFAKKLQLYLLNSIDNNLLSLQLILKKFFVCYNKKNIKPCFFLYKKTMINLIDRRNKNLLYKLIKDQLNYLCNLPEKLAKTKSSIFYMKSLNIIYHSHLYKWDTLDASSFYISKQFILNETNSYKKYNNFLLYKSFSKFIQIYKKLTNYISVERLLFNLDWYYIYINKLKQNVYSRLNISKPSVVSSINRKKLMIYLLKSNNLYNILIFKTNYIANNYLKYFYNLINMILYYFLKKRYNNIFYNYENIKISSRNFFINFYMIQKINIYLNYCI